MPNPSAEINIGSFVIDKGQYKNHYEQLKANVLELIETELDAPSKPEIVIATMGKSRTLTEALMKPIVEALPDTSRFKHAYAKRLRLNSEENEMIYQYSDTLHRNIEVVNALEAILGKYRNKRIVFVDDHLDSGTKVLMAYQTLTSLAFNDFIFLCLTSRANHPNMLLSRPAASELRQRILVGYKSDEFLELTRRLSVTLSDVMKNALQGIRPKTSIPLRELLEP